VIERCPHCPIATECKGQHVRRYCELVDPRHPDYDPRYIATLAKPLRPLAAESLELIARMKSCPYRSVFPPCGCAGARCGLRAGAVVNHLDCFECIRKFPD
jgi:hypothetical protein